MEAFLFLIKESLNLQEIHDECFRVLINIIPKVIKFLGLCLKKLMAFGNVLFHLIDFLYLFEMIHEFFHFKLYKSNKTLNRASTFLCVISFFLFCWGWRWCRNCRLGWLFARSWSFGATLDSFGLRHVEKLFWKGDVIFFEFHQYFFEASGFSLRSGGILRSQINKYF